MLILKIPLKRKKINLHRTKFEWMKKTFYRIQVVYERITLLCRLL